MPPRTRRVICTLCAPLGAHACWVLNALEYPMFMNDTTALLKGMGSNLVGKDINHPTGSEEYLKAKADWEATGKAKAQTLFDMIIARFGK